MILLATKGAKMSQWHCRILLQLSLPTFNITSNWPVKFGKKKNKPGTCYEQVVTLSTANPSGSLYVNTVNLLPCCITAGLFYEETLTPFPGDKSRLSLQEMVNPVWIHKQFKVLTLVSDVNWVCDFVFSRTEASKPSLTYFYFA